MPIQAPRADFMTPGGLLRPGVFHSSTVIACRPPRATGVPQHERNRDLEITSATAAESQVDSPCMSRFRNHGSFRV